MAYLLKLSGEVYYCGPGGGSRMWDELGSRDEAFLLETIEEACKVSRVSYYWWKVVDAEAPHTYLGSVKRGVFTPYKGFKV